MRIKNDKRVSRMTLSKSTDNQISVMNQELRRNLKKVMKDNKITIKEVAKHIGVNHNTLLGYFSESRNLNIPIGIVYAVCRLTRTNFFHVAPTLMKDLASFIVMPNNELK